MTTSKMNPKVDQFIKDELRWKKAFVKLREIILSFNLVEEFKWSKPCYSLKDKNILLIHGFKEYCAILFMKGAILEDSRGILVQQTRNVQAGRQIRFKSLQEIIELESVIRDYVMKAIEVEKAGLEVTLKETGEFVMSDELLKAFQDMPELKIAFEKLTPGRQRGYLLKFSEPKQSKTRVARIEKYMAHILLGKGLNDK